MSRRFITIRWNRSSIFVSCFVLCSNESKIVWNNLQQSGLKSTLCEKTRETSKLFCIVVFCRSVDGVFFAKCTRALKVNKTIDYKINQLLMRYIYMCGKLYRLFFVCFEKPLKRTKQPQIFNNITVLFKGIRFMMISLLRWKKHVPASILA